MAQEEDELLFRVYVTDLLQAVYKYFGGLVTGRYLDMINRKGHVETRSAEEIKQSICEGLRKLSEEE